MTQSVLNFVKVVVLINFCQTGFSDGFLEVPPHRCSQLILIRRFIFGEFFLTLSGTPRLEQLCSEQ